MQEALSFSNQEYLILNNRKIRQNFMLSGQSIKSFLENQDSLNYSQSTHQQSIHESVSESAYKLNIRYSKLIENEKLDKLINKLSKDIKNVFSSKKIFIKDKDKDNFKNKEEAVIRCLDRITDIEYTFLDENSGLSVRELLALVYIAINDSSLRVGNLDNALENIIEGLYEIQMGDNIVFVDEGSKDYADSPICTSGTFNKLIEKLQGIHPDCELRFISKSTASLKLPIIAKEESNKYLNDFFESNLRNYFICENLIRSLEAEGIEVIWDNIKDAVCDRAYNEFKIIYPNKTSKAFIEFLDYAKYTDISDLVNNFKQKNSHYQK